MKKKRGLFALGLAAVAAIVLSAVAVTESARAEAPDYGFVGDSFTAVGASVNPASADPSGTITDRGVLLSFARGGSVKVGGTLSGPFEMEYFPVIAGNALSEWNIVFTDEKTGEEFAVNVGHSAEYNNASVDFGGVRSGVFYPFYPAATTDSRTAVANASGLYTRISGGKMSIKFDPAAMRVYAISGGTEYLVWDLTAAAGDGLDTGRKMSRSFGDYTVRLEAANVSASGGQALLCAVDGYALDGPVFSSCEPIIGANITEYGITGEAYVLPEMTAFDFREGKLDYSLSVTTESGSPVRTENGMFRPTEKGNYLVTVTAETSAGATARKTVVVTVFDKADLPEVVYEYDKPPVTGTVKAGTTVYVPEVKAFGGRIAAAQGKSCPVTIYRDGVKLESHAGLSGGFEYTVGAIATYKFSYKLFGEEITSFTLTGEASAVELDLGGASETVKLGAAVDLSDAKLVINGVPRDCELRVEYPDGRVYGNRIFVAEEIGAYRVYGSAAVGEETYFGEAKLNVYEYIESTFVSEDTAMTTSYGVSKQTGRYGAKISFANPTIPAVWSHEIDLSKLRNLTEVRGHNSENVDDIYATKDDATPLIEFSMEPAAYGVSATSKVAIYLRDAADPENNYITVNIDHRGSPLWSYVRAKAFGQTFVGFDNGSNSSAYLNGTKGRRWTGEYYGHGLKYSFFGDSYDSAAAVEPARRTLKLFYDDATKQLLVKNYNAGTNEIVNDFDDPQWCEGPRWTGFTSDKAILSVEVSDIARTRADMFVYNVGGISTEREAIAFTSAPEITIRDERTTLYAVEGVTVGLPSATAADYLGGAIANPVVKVYYVDGAGTEFDAYTDGKTFTPTRAGNYIVKYIATDEYGNRSEKTLPLEVAGAGSADFTITIDGDTDNVTVKAGEKIALIGTDKVETHNALGTRMTMTREAFFEGDAPVAIDARGRIFIEKAGVYTIRYTVTDEAGRTATAQYTITAQAGEAGIYGSAPYFVGFLSGESYALPEMLVKDYSAADSAPVAADIYVKNDAAGDFEKAEGGVFVAPKVEYDNPGSITIEYRLGGAVVKRYENLPVVNAYETKNIELVPGVYADQNLLHIDKTLKTHGSTVSIENLYAKVTVEGESGGAEFINKVASRGLSAEFSGETGVKGISLTVTDALDAEKQVKLTYKPSGSALELYVNDAPTGSTTAGAFGTAERISFAYGFTDGTVRDGNNGVLATIETYLGGDPFEGFSEYVYLDWTVEKDAAADTAVAAIRSVSGMGFTSADDDRVAPNIYLDEDFNGGTYKTGTKITIATAHSYDVFGSVKSFTVSVTHTDVQSQKSVVFEGADPGEKHEFTLEKAGTYYVVYRAEDYSGNWAEKSIPINAYIETAPVITLSGEVQKRGSVGTEITLPSYTVTYASEHSDNLSFVEVIAPNNVSTMLTELKFTPEKQGMYRVRYMALDYCGMYTILEFEIACE